MVIRKRGVKDGDKRGVKDGDKEERGEVMIRKNGLSKRNETVEDWSANEGGDNTERLLRTFNWIYLGYQGG